MANELTIEKYTLSLASQAIEWVTKDIQCGKIPPVTGYNVGSEITQGLLKIMQTKDKNGRSALEVCTKESVLSAMRDMAVQGISMGRSQCYPIVYGSQLQIMRSYFGTITVFNRMFPDLKVTCNVVHEGDEYHYRYNELYDFEYLEISEVKLENRNRPIRAAYGSVVDMTTKEKVYGCVMTWEEIQKSWSHAKTDKVQKEFPQEMAKRTLINRMLKQYVNTSPVVDPAMASAFSRTTENEYDNSDRNQPVNDEVSKIIHQKSRGADGLNAILKQAEKPVEEQKPVHAEATKALSVDGKAEKTAVDEFETEDGEIIEVAKTDAPEAVFERGQSKSAKAEKTADNWDEIPF